jgi:hypothetical protein
LTTSYTAIGLTSGVTYEFRVEARNSYNYGAPSAEIVLLAAFKPEAPGQPQTDTINHQVQVSWPEPVDNGSPILGYKIFI